MMPRHLLRSLLLVLALATAGPACSSNAPPEVDKAATGADAPAAGHPGPAAAGPDAPAAIVQLSPEAAARIRVRVAPVEARALSGELSTTGRVDFDQDRVAHISPRVPGRVHRVQVTLGDRVKAGQALAIIDSIELGRAKSSFLRARTQLELARRTREREEGLLSDKITSEQSVLEARSAEQRARAEYQAARQALRLLGLSDRQIDAASADDASAALFPLTSPVAGTVVDKHVTMGQVVSPESDLFTVADLSRLWIWIDVYERDLARVHLNDDAVVVVDAFPDRTFEGQIAYVRAQVDPDTRTARARIDVSNADGALRPGMFATITVTDPEGAGKPAGPPSLVVPADAIQRDGDRRVVFVKVGDNRYARHAVTLGRQTDRYVEVTSGLSAGQSVVVEGGFILKSEAHKHLMGGDED